jgi:hypothetical protein
MVVLEACLAYLAQVEIDIDTALKDLGVDVEKE